MDVKALYMRGASGQIPQSTCIRQAELHSSSMAIAFREADSAIEDAVEYLVLEKPEGPEIRNTLLPFLKSIKAGEPLEPTYTNLEKKVRGRAAKSAAAHYFVSPHSLRACYLSRPSAPHDADVPSAKEPPRPLTSTTPPPLS